MPEPQQTPRPRLHFNALRWSRPRLIYLGLYVLAVVVSLVVDVEYFQKPESDTRCDVASSGYESWADHLYKPLMGLKFHSREAEHVAQVVISPAREPLEIMTNTCEGRRFLSYLVTRVDAENPRVIAIDKFYNEGSCRNAEVNAAFREALTHTRAPVVVGQATHERESDKPSPDCLVLTRPFDFAKPVPGRGAFPAQPVRSGLTRLNENLLKIPLAWPAFSNDAVAEAGSAADRLAPGFALTAASVYDPAVATRGMMGAMLVRNQHPYSGFFSAIPAESAMSLLCADDDGGAVVQARDWGDCRAVARRRVSLTGKVVVIGEHSEYDLQATPGADLYGMDLQANYIESLIDGHYMRALPTWLDLGMVVLFFIAIYLLEVAVHHRVLNKLQSVLAGFALFVVLMLVSLACLSLGYFTPLFLLSSTAILILFGVRLMSLTRDFAEHHLQ